MRVAASGPKYEQKPQRIQFYKALGEGVGNLRGVSRQGAISALPLTPSVGWGGMEIEGYVPPANAARSRRWTCASPRRTISGQWRFRCSTAGSSPPRTPPTRRRLR